MKTALLALFFLLFVFYTELTAQHVLDINGTPVRSRQPYHIRNATNHSQAISLDQTENQTCPISVVLGTDPKDVIFDTVDPGEGNIMTGELLSIRFFWVPKCAEPSRWKVQAENDSCPILIGPPDNSAGEHRFKFLIKSDRDQPDVYNLFFRDDFVELALATKMDRDEEIRLVLIRPCYREAPLKVKFYPTENCYANSVCNSFT